MTRGRCMKALAAAAISLSLVALAITERLDGKTVDWLEQVTDAQYRDSK